MKGQSAVAVEAGPPSSSESLLGPPRAGEVPAGIEGRGSIVRDNLPMTTMKILSQALSFGGIQRVLEHRSDEIGLAMRFSVWMPPQAQQARVPALLYLAGLTCNEETFMIKAGAQRVAAELGIALIAPDTSPRGPEVDRIGGAGASWDFGIGAGFYLDAIQPPWATHWRMESWLMNELLPLMSTEFAIDADRIGVFGHSMGGHGALTLALRHPGRFKSLSAFAPICAPSQCPWGEKAFGNYLGSDREQWLTHDASALMQAQNGAPFPKGILVDQGLSDQFLAEQLHPELLDTACADAGQPLTLRRHDGYDHGYYFVATFMEDHLRHHARILELG